MGPIATPIFAILTVAVTAGNPAPHRLGPHAAATAIVAVATARERPAKPLVAPVVAYSAESSDSFDAPRASDAVGEFSDAATYAAFEPERLERPAKPHRSLLVRMRNAASRILALTASLPHF